jgi:2-methylisocitrate lyase-like PEP mutase family enzyme
MDTIIQADSKPVEKTATPTTAVARLRQMLSDPSKTIVAPGVYDGITARLALAAGFECL